MITHYGLSLNCLSVANYIISEINNFNLNKKYNEKIYLTGSRLQMLLYLCEIEYMKKFHGESLLENDFSACPIGPAIIGIYGLYCQNRDGSMTTKYENESLNLDKKIKTIIDCVLELTKKLDTEELKSIINNVDGLWYKVYNEEETDKTISKEKMYNFYLNKDLFEHISISAEKSYKNQNQIESKNQLDNPKTLFLFRK